MVNLPQLQRITTELAPVNHLIGNGNNGNCRVKPRKRMANCGFMRSDLWVIKHGYSIKTVNKYRGVLYGDEAFRPPTPTTGGRGRINNKVAEKLQKHGVRPRHNKVKRTSCTPKRVNTAVVADNEIKDEEIIRIVMDGLGNPEVMQGVTTIGVAKHGINEMLKMLIQAEAEIAECCLDCPADKDTTS
jgi:hypothetical protein